MKCNTSIRMPSIICKYDVYTVCDLHKKPLTIVTYVAEDTLKYLIK